MIHLLLDAAPAGAGGGMGGMIFMLVAIFVIMWFFMVRPAEAPKEDS